MTTDTFYVLFVAVLLGPTFGIGYLLGAKLWTRPPIPLPLDALDLVHADGHHCLLRWIHPEKDKTLTVCRRPHH